jgi:hypothetical protein
MTWLRELSAELVTHERESHAALVARLQLELPTAPRQVALRRRLEGEARVRVQQRLIAEARAEQVTYTPLERRLGEARLQALMEELAAADPWFTHPERKHAS